ncbi:Regulator of chromosome condensation [Wickerhamomyces ciferrii]|uniref:Regulator of chromosome condensation n=1 Tax=Wickerhamomyces ciferrii (strain ATCC 14091 / BCRC 22168 / CBS 111 / JCM 3599 / NBRC 0793 / NRRL Y-1031 F-60-10) TaxID=1206466 RepID=K0KY49_WICCF|nr:Regulator of chromosome condensation [Wickerhamomyces ciferrii]CCH46028.1 Regulator of chromosome condensation [Wickerhamomyces ciferrii]
MARLDRKRSLEPENGRSTKRVKHTGRSFNSFKNLPKINEIPKAKTQQLDIFVFGSGSMCELGLGPAAKNKEVKRPRLNPYLKDKGIVDFAVGGMHTLALDDKNQVWSWGGNDSGVLGRDTSKVKEQLKDMDDAGSDDDEDGDLNEAESTPGLVEGLPKDLKVVQLAATDNLSAVLLENGEVYAWGTFRCNEGILGFKNDITKQSTPVKIDEFKEITQLASGKDHILGLDTKGVVFAWGNGQQLQLGRRISERNKLKTLEPREFGLADVVYISSGEFHCFAITKDGKVLTWGLNQYGQCGVSSELEDGSLISVPTEVEDLADKKIVQIAAGEHHTLALSEDGSVYAFGRIDMFEIGIAKKDLPESTFRDVHGNARSVPVPTKIPNLPKTRNIAVGSHHSLAITEDGVVFAWGFGETYAIGLGPAGEDVETPTRIKNTATQDHDIQLIGAGGQFSVSGGVKLSDEETEKREDKYEDAE